MSAAHPPDPLLLPAAGSAFPARLLLRDRRFLWRWLIYFAPWAIVWGALVLFHYDQRDRAATAALEAQSRSLVDAGAAVLTTLLERAQTDLRGLAAAAELAVSAEAAADSPPPGLGAEWINFLALRSAYERLSYVDATGRERLRVDQSAGRSARVVKVKSTADHAYAELAAQLPPDGLDLSPLEAAPGRAPPALRLRLAVPLIGRDGQRRGLLVMRYRAEELSSRLATLVRPGDPGLSLLDQRGVWLHGAPANSAAGDRLETRFPGARAPLLAAASGQTSNRHGLWTWTTIRPAPRATPAAALPFEPAEARSGEVFWQLVVRVPAEVLDALSDQQRGERVLPLVAGVVLLLWAAWRMAAARQRQRLAERDLRGLNQSLEQQVGERTRRLQNEIFDRQMAERRYRESSEQYQHLVATTVDAYWLLDDGGGFLNVNQAACEMLGASRDALLGMTVSELDPPDAERGLRQRLAELGRAGFERFETRLRRPDGEIIEVEISASFLPDYLRFTVFVRDISERKRSERERRLASLVMSNADEAILVADAAGRVLSVNPAFAKITGIAQDAAAGEHVDRLGLSAVDGKSTLSQLLATQHGWRAEMRGRRRSGEVYPVWLTASTVKDDAEQVASYVCVFSDITEIKESQARLDFLAHHDALTGLPNRLLFRARLEHSVERAERAKSRIAVMFIDLDHFKEVNDLLGHAVGDQLLIDLASAMAGCLRAEDTLARLGGDEFVVLLEQVTGPDSVDTVLDKLRQVYPWAMVGSGHRVEVTASIGVALYPDHATDADGLLARADAAMYRAKDTGRDRACYA